MAAGAALFVSFDISILPFSHWCARCEPQHVVVYCFDLFVGGPVAHGDIDRAQRVQLAAPRSGPVLVVVAAAVTQLVVVIRTVLDHGRPRSATSSTLGTPVAIGVDQSTLPLRTVDTHALS